MSFPSNFVQIRAWAPSAVPIVSSAAPSCWQYKQAGNAQSGNYLINRAGGSSSNAFNIYCEMETDGGGWDLISLLRYPVTTYGERFIFGTERCEESNVQNSSENCFGNIREKTNTYDVTLGQQNDTEMLVSAVMLFYSPFFR